MKEVRAGPVAVAAVSAFHKGVADHIAGRGLAVGPGDNDDLHILSGNGEDVLRDLHCDDAGKGSSAASGPAEDSARQFTGGNR